MGIFWKKGRCDGCSDLEERVETLERKHRALDAEWNETYDRMRHTLGRISKRSAIIEKAQEQEGEAEGDPLTPSASPFDDGLSPSQRRITQQILALRQRQ